MEFPISKVTGKISTKLHFENSIQCISIFRKVALPEISRNFLLTKVAAFQSTGLKTNY